MKCPDHILEVEDKVWEIAREMQIDVASLLLQMDYRTWRRALESMEHWASLEEWENGTTEFKDGNEVKIFGMNSLK